MNLRHIIVPGLTNRLSIRHHWRGVSGLLRLLRHEPSDLIWIHARLQVLICRLLLAFRIWKPTCPVMFTHHGLPYGRGYQPMVHRLCKGLEQILVATCPPQHLVFLNHRMAGWMARDARAKRLARHCVHILHNCSDLKALPQQTNSKIKRLVMTGRTGRQKDYDFAVRLLAHLPVHFRLTLCGPGTEVPAFQAHIASLIPKEAFDRITFTGPLENARKPLRQADAYLLTSRYEGTPIGALEAFEAGLPIILRNYDGANDLITKHPCAILMKSENFAKEAERVSALLDFFDRDAQALRTEIREVWRTNWSPEIFGHNARALVRSVLTQTISQAVTPDYVHDAPMPRPDRHRNATARAQALPPYYKGVAPLAENGLRQ